LFRSSGWGGRVVRQRPAKPRTRVRIPSPPRLDFRESKKDAIVGICKTCVSLGETQARLAQLVSALPRHGRGHWFESSIAHGITQVIRADVAQLARAPPCQGGGRGFESRHPLSGCSEASICIIEASFAIHHRSGASLASQSHTGNAHAYP